ncbi:single-stranded-DNA-specific exonuclease RecJ [Lactococcus hircilactis]|uniref:Single-stranded-DNA-specific exonuclease RecJ n=1 Tax=Lactococcus hircilactis TaxID=1494462 RepID=A0A7X1Z7E8_9LACT|nr:single-stranded-DNA-specific exonuclease RecJ [Lactococcus hircilactis]MQW39027.1 single-stranded-DNA-specific exonuclease RecJ [Lactococcus hircilactis]
MINSHYNWELDETTVSEDFLSLTKPYHMDRLTSQILWQRGIQTKAALAGFLNPTLEQLYDPFLLHDMKKAVTRILQAIEKNERILIYGDYDADGMTSSSVMKSALDELGAQVQVYLPNRFTDGYGPNLEVYKYFIENEQIDLIITVDNGVAGFEAIKYAQNAGVDVVVTDHHSMPEQLPPAYAIVHPEHPDSEYPFKYLAGVGVAFKVACALLEYIPTEMLDLVAIGTIADMVSLTDENRVLVTYGLKILAQTERVGLQELMRLAGCDFENINEETVGFMIAPRLNALGRLDDPNPAVTLLTGWDEDEGAAIAQMIEEKNTARKQITEQIFEKARTMVTDEPVQVLYHKDWHKGVLGIVAGRLLEELQKPVIMLALEDGILRGSARSTENFDIFKALNAHRSLFIAFGGHKQAAGMTLELENVPAIKKAMSDYIMTEKLDMTKKPILKLEQESRLKDLSLATIENLSKLAPFGMDHPKPRFLVENFEVTQSRSMGKDNAHLKLRIKQDSTTLDAIYFGHGPQQLEFNQSDTKLAVSLATNTWNGNTSLQLRIEDAKACGIELIDIRSQKINLPEHTVIFANNTLKNDIMKEVLILADAPTTSDGLSVLTKAIDMPELKLIYFKNEIAKAYYLTGFGTREQYAKLYQAIKKFPEFDVRYKLKSLADYLKIPELLLIKMIQVFQELDFVSITDGLMKVNKDAARREISESNIYQNLKKLVRLQELFALAPVKEIYHTLKKGEVKI